jgi:ssDNA-binding Zn-finger/Zn-ribbon topoisomerase 1
MQTGKKCPKCQYGEVLVRFNKRLRKRFLGCACFPGCDWTYSPNTRRQLSVDEKLSALDNHQQNNSSGSEYIKPMAQQLLPTGKPHISFSEISDWMECSWRHKVKHVLKINVFRPSIHLTFGTATHAVVENFLNNKVVDLEIAGKIIDADKEKYAEVEEFQLLDRAKLLTNIQNIMNDFPAFMEENFPKWEFVRAEENLYEDLKQFFEAHDGLSFKGFIDCVIKVPTKKEGEFLYWIIDWKTANRPWMLDKIKDVRVRTQLVLYKKFWTTKHNLPLSKVRCGFVTLLKSGKPGKLCKLIPISVGEKSAEKAMNVVNNSLASIKRGSALKNRNACRWCDYKDTEHCT